MEEVTPHESEELSRLRNEVKQDITIAIANFKIWLLITVLSNVILIGVPALYVFFTTQNTSALALAIANTNREKLDDRLLWITRTDARIQALERFEAEKNAYQAPAAPPIPK